MPIVVPDDGEVALLRRMLKPAAGDDLALHLRLFANNIVPNRETVIGDVLESTFAGYASKPLLPTGWGAPQSVGGVAQMVWAAGFLSWLASAGTQTVYGYYVTDAADATLLWIERFPSPQLVTTVVPIVVLPLMRLHSEVEPAP